MSGNLLPVHESANQHFFDYAVTRLASVAARALTTEMRRLRDGGLLSGATSAERFAHFSEQLADPVVQRAILDRYPVLARHLATLTRQLIVERLEVVRRASRDRRQLAELLGSSSDVGAIVDWKPGLSDPHGFGRTVWFIQFECGGRVAYKPRSFAVDHAWNGIIAWNNRVSSGPPLQPTTFLARDVYGWSTWIEPRECRDLSEVAEYYERQGILLAWFYFLGAGDFHAENIVADGAHPVPIDLEVLLRPMSPREWGGPSECNNRSLANSCWATNMLPIWSRSRSGAAHVTAAIGGTGDRDWSGPYFRWTDIGTDRCRLIQHDRPTQQFKCLPLLHGQHVAPADFIESVVRGFSTTYAAIQGHRDELFLNSGPLSTLRAIAYRYISRPTQDYDTLLFNATAAENLESGAIQDLVFESLLQYESDSTSVPSIVEAEKRSLWQRDIPRFTIPADSNQLKGVDGELQGLSFACSAFDALRRRIDLASDDERRREEGIIRGLMRVAYATQCRLRSPTILERDENPTVGVEQFDEAVKNIVNVLSYLAVPTPQGMTWLTLLPTYSGPDLTPEFVDGSLYNGTSGIAIFLAGAADAFHCRATAKLARSALDHAIHWAQTRDPKSINQLDGFEGRKAVVYAIAEVGRILTDDALIDQAEELDERLATEIPNNGDSLDFLDGAAGSILVDLHLNNLRPSLRRISRAMNRAEEILEHVQCGRPIGRSSLHSFAPLVGLAHGASGTILAASRLFQITEHRALLEVIESALVEENAAWSDSHQDWIDRRSKAPVVTPAWCAGSAGIGLARLELAKTHPERFDVAETLRRAVASARRTYRSQPQYLCCGSAGRHWLLHSAGIACERKDWIEEAQRLAMFEIGQAAAAGFCSCKNVGAKYTSVFDGGIAGLGLTWLRLSRTSSASNICTLA